MYRKPELEMHTTCRCTGRQRCTQRTGVQEDRDTHNEQVYRKTEMHNVLVYKEPD